MSRPLRSDVSEFVPAAGGASKSSNFKTIIDCGSAPVFSLVVGTGFRQTSYICEIVGNGARINRCGYGDTVKLRLEADSEVALKELKEHVYKRVNVSRLKVASQYDTDKNDKLKKAASTSGISVLAWLRLPENAYLREEEMLLFKLRTMLVNEIYVNGPKTATQLRNLFPREPNLPYSVAHGITSVYKYDDILVETIKAGLHVVDGKNSETVVYLCSCDTHCLRKQTLSPYCE
jgi:hypothetical protein